VRDAKTKAMLVLERLQKAGAGGVTNVELTKTCLRYGARIYELRAKGHDIETVDEGRGNLPLHPPRAAARAGARADGFAGHRGATAGRAAHRQAALELKGSYMAYGKKYSRQPKHLMGKRSKGSSRPRKAPFITRARLKGGDNFQQPLCKPNENPATISRQVLRGMLRKKAKADIVQQYGLGQVSLGYDPNFPRRVRRSVIHAMQARWFKQIVADQNEGGAGQRDQACGRDRRVRAPLLQREVRGEHAGDIGRDGAARMTPRVQQGMRACCWLRLHCARCGYYDVRGPDEHDGDATGRVQPCNHCPATPWWWRARGA
jgi:hypothetical protein